MLIPGNKLNPKQKQQVLAAYVHRHMSGMSDEAWLNVHAFHFVKDGSRLKYNRNFAEPYYSK